MASVDRFRLNPGIVVPAAAANDGQRQFSQAENNWRTERMELRVTGQVDITGAGTGLRNGGSILAALGDVGFVDAGPDRIAIDARLARFIAECWSPSPLPAVRLANANIQAATQLSESLPLWFSAARTISPGETKFVEVNKQGLLQTFLTPQRFITRLAAGGGLVGTVTNLQAQVVQVCDSLMNQTPWLSAYVRQVVQDVTGANPALKIDLRGNRYIRAIAIQQDTNEGDVSNILNSLVLRGDSRSIIGDRGIPFNVLFDMQAEEFGGQLRPGYLMIDFARYGRLTSLFNQFEDTNLRIEADVQPSAGNTGSRLRVALLEYESTPATLPQLPFNI